MFKSRRRYRPLFTRQPKRRRRFSSLWLIVTLPLVLLVLELLTRIFIDITGNREEFVATTSKLESAYRLKFVSEDGRVYKSLGTEGELIAQRSLSVGYKLLGDRQSEYWQINNSGFRSDRPISADKPPEEVRIFLLGNSTAFGYGSRSNQETIAHQLESRLQQRLVQQQNSPQLYRPEVLPVDEAQKKQALAKPAQIKPGNYRVINAAVPGYASGNELAQLALQILSYKPDVIIVLNGYTDLMLESGKSIVDIPQLEEFLDNAPSHFRAYVGQLLDPLRSKSYLVKILQDKVLLSSNSRSQLELLLGGQKANLTDYLPSTEAELNSRQERYFQNHKQMVSLSTGAGIPLIVAVQPEITGRDPSQLTDTESAISTQLGREYIQTVKNSYPQFVAASQKLASIFPKNVKAVNLYNLGDKYPSPTFADAIHLTKEANQVVAEQLYYAIASLPKLQIVSRQPSLPASTPKNDNAKTP